MPRKLQLAILGRIAYFINGLKTRLRLVFLRFPKVSPQLACMDDAILHGKLFGIPLFWYKFSNLNPYNNFGDKRLPLQSGFNFQTTSATAAQIKYIIQMWDSRVFLHPRANGAKRRSRHNPERGLLISY